MGTEDGPRKTVDILPVAEEFREGPDIPPVAEEFRKGPDILPVAGEFRKGPDILPGEEVPGTGLLLGWILILQVREEAGDRQDLLKAAGKV